MKRVNWQPWQLPREVYSIDPQHMPPILSLTRHPQFNTLSVEDRVVDLDFNPGGGKGWKGLRRGIGLSNPIPEESMKL